MLRAIRCTVLTLLFLLVCPTAPFSFVSAQTAHKKLAPATALRFNLSTDKTVYQVGEPIVVRYSLENVGSEPVYIRPMILPVVTSSGGLRIDVFTQEGKKLYHGYLEGLFVGYPPDTDFVSMIKEGFLLLREEHFYGKREELFMDWYKALGEPGRYKFVGTFYEDFTAFLNEAQLQSLNGLDYPVWVGTISSNEVWIEVVK